MYQFTSKSEQDTITFASQMAKDLKCGDILLLCGDLGAGKTKFTQGILEYFGLENQISSPTFTIVNEYDTSSLSIYHFDLYRLADVDEFYAIGGEEYFEKGLCILEWGEIIKEILPKEYIKINIEKDSTNTEIRYFTIETYGEKYSTFL